MNYRKSVFRSLAMVSQLGLCVIAPVFFCIFIGHQLDTRFGWKTMVPMVILGVLGGARCAWQMAKRTLEAEQKEDARIREERLASGIRTGISKPKQPSRVFTDRQAAAEADRPGEEADGDGMAE